MTDESQVVPTPRRQGDVVLEQMRGELAVLSTKVELGAEATKSSIGAVTESMKRLEDKVDRVLEAQSDPAASAGGRQLLEKIADLEHDRDDHHTRIKGLEGFATEARTAYRTLRAQMTIISFVLGLLAGLATLLSLTHTT